MRTEQPVPVRLTDYRPPAYLVDEVHLDFALEPARTRVTARLKVRRNGEHAEPLRFDGERLTLRRIAVDDVDLAPHQYAVSDTGLTIHEVPDAFTLLTEVEIDPSANTALMGLYISGGRFCTQCEAEGFRTITYFPDRPDVLSRYTVRIEADKAAYPHLLSNGNRTEAGELESGRHYAVWNDPFPKPCYLFALVAGDLDVIEDTYATLTGRKIDLAVYVDTGMAPRAAYALDALKRSMRWDEEVFGREYDLDLFMIVAVRDFNFGAMENKGLNIFNASLLLADSATATDLDYERIESVVAHEYFHNWTGDRITCRDWFQLCLKEGLTVFRDQEFSADQRSRSVQRIKDVKALRGRQFPEDAGPMAHPVRPTSYLKIDNFYTATVYEKGAEVVRMLKTLLGPEDFRKGMDLYFERCDGTASTVEAFIGCFADASDRDLSDFFGWYEQAGTPTLTIKSRYDAAAKALDIELAQVTAPTPGQPKKRALTIPIRLGLLDAEGRELGDEQIMTFTADKATVRVEGLPFAPVISALRDFSAPVKLVLQEPTGDRYVRLAADSDLYNRWEAGQSLARQLLIARVEGRPDEDGETRYAEALGRALDDQAAEPAFKTLLLELPSEAELAQALKAVDPNAIHAAREAVRQGLAAALSARLERLHDSLADGGPFSPDASAAGRRSLRNAALELLAAAPSEATAARALRHFDSASNMTEAMGGLYALTLIGGEPMEEALERFYARWSAEPLVIDKWFAIQARIPGPEVLGRVVGLTAHPAFEPKNPNRLRALVSTFAMANPVAFHDASGAGYRFLADQILAVDGFNPMTAARMVEAFGHWRRYREDLGALMKTQLERIAAHPGVSKNVFELAQKALADAPS